MSEIIPNLLYVADVPVENFVHGSALMYRLLENYPTERLRIVEVHGESSSQRRLPHVCYASFRIPAQRLLTTRLSSLACGAIQLSGGCSARSITNACGSFLPEAVLTVGHGYSWQAAARFARHRNIPLHMIVHDNWCDTFNTFPLIKQALKPRFARAYRGASSRLCVSPYMAETYQTEFGKAADVLYPARAASLTAYDTPSPRLESLSSIFRVGYAGTVHSPGHIAALRAIAGALHALGGELHVFGPGDAKALMMRGLDSPSIHFQGLLKPDELVKFCRHNVDTLVVPISFVVSELRAMRMNFPSKLTDYTAAGLPILIYGPPTCSAVKWANDNPGVAAVVDVEGPDLLKETIGRLISDSEWRQQLATRAIEVGRKQFDSGTADRIFRKALSGVQAGENGSSYRS